MILWQIIQVTVIIIQDRKGPRFFIPKKYLPEKYDYYTPIYTKLDNCVICMSPIDSGYMVTPCRHAFHSDCLEQWMDVKMECPTCRGHLPVP